MNPRMWELYREMEYWDAEQANYFLTELTKLVDSKIEKDRYELPGFEGTTDLLDKLTIIK